MRNWPKCKAIQAHPEAWNWFRRQPGLYRRIRVWWVDAARVRPEVFRQRLDSLIDACKARKLMGYGGIEKYF